MRQIVLDTETTGLSAKDGHRIIEIGCVEMINRRLTGNNYHQYINPRRQVDEGAFKIHGLSNEFLKNYPTFEEIIAEFFAFIGDSELIIHNARFDVGFINQEVNLYAQQQAIKNVYPKISLSSNVIDTLVIARDIHQGQRNSLDALCRRYNVDVTNRKLHGALLDADLLAKVYIDMTGGQISFNLDHTYVKKNIKTDISLNSKTLKVIHATADELRLHQDFMQKILN